MELSSIRKNRRSIKLHDEITILCSAFFVVCFLPWEISVIIGFHYLPANKYNGDVVLHIQNNTKLNAGVMRWIQSWSGWHLGERCYRHQVIPVIADFWNRLKASFEGIRLISGGREFQDVAPLYATAFLLVALWNWGTLSIVASKRRVGKFLLSLFPVPWPPSFSSKVIIACLLSWKVSSLPVVFAICAKRSIMSNGGTI